MLYATPQLELSRLPGQLARYYPCALAFCGSDRQESGGFLKQYDPRLTDFDFI